MELMSSAIWQALHAAGLRVQPVTADQVDILVWPNSAGAAKSGEATDRRSLRMRVLARDRPLSPTGLRRLADRFPAPALVIVPTATAAVRAAAARLGWSLITTNPRDSAGPQGLLLWPSGMAVAIGVAEPEPTGSVGSPRRGRVPWGSLTVTRRLAEGAAGTQTQLAELAGVTQARVSQVLKELTRAGLAGPSDRRRGTYAATDPHRMLQHWLAGYPGPGGISTYWYGLEDPTQQARAVIALLHEQASTAESGPPGPAAVVSGDVAADQIAPWRRPQRAVVYARRGADLADIGLTPSGEEATLELTVPQDPGVWSTPASHQMATWLGPPGLPLADPLQILWDVRRAPGTDRDQAADHLLAVLTAAYNDGTRTGGGEQR